jgi:hypothetical protein
MKENDTNWRKPILRLAALLVLTAGTVFVMELPGADAQSPQCGSNFNLCQGNCPYIFGTNIREPGCLSQCVGMSDNCLSSGLGGDNCDNILSACFEINAGGGDGPSVGDCYGTYGQCSVSQGNKHFAPMQGPPPEPMYDPDCQQTAQDDQQACLQRANPDCIVQATGQVSSRCCLNVRIAYQQAYCRIQ